MIPKKIDGDPIYHWELVTPEGNSIKFHATERGASRAKHLFDAVYMVRTEIRGQSGKETDR